MIPKSEYRVDNKVTYVTYEMVDKYHTKDEIRRFSKWYTGQTGMVASNGDMAIFVDDYERWLREGRKKEQNLETWD